MIFFKIGSVNLLTNSAIAQAKNLLNLCSFVGLLLLTNFFISYEVKADLPYCPEYQDEERSQVKKLFYSKKYKFSFEVPENFRVVEIKKDWLAIQTPAQYHMFSCMVRNNIAFEPDSSVDILIDSAPPDIDTWIGNQIEHNPKGLTKVRREVTKNGGTSFIYFSQGMYLTMNITFLSPDNSKIITVSTSCLQPDEWQPGSRHEDILFDYQTFLLVTNTIGNK